MPKNEIDYSNTIIYKIICNDTIVSDLYVGHTTNFVQRKHAHKQGCINEKSPNHKCKLYEVIRNNGGWVNWKMEIINFFNCKNHYEARKKEQEYFLSLNATLNSIEPYAIPKPKEVIAKNKLIKEVLHCKECNKYFSNTKLLETHNKTNKHMKNLDTMITESSPKLAPKYICSYCDYNCSKESDYKKHLLTLKHKTNYDEMHEKEQKMPKKYYCNCGKEYNYRQGLHTHKKNCNVHLKNIIMNNEENDEKIIINESQHIEKLTNVIMELVKSNTELQKQTMELQQQLLEVCKTR
jgi:hypothetical protein